MVITTYFVSSEYGLRENIRNMKGAAKERNKNKRIKTRQKNLNAKKQDGGKNKW
jgi:hypothetical protein